MKLINLFLVLLITFNIKSTEVNQNKTLEDWTEALNCEIDSDKENQIQMLEKLFEIFNDNETDSDKLNNHLKFCSDAVANEKLLHSVRVFARINLGITEKFLAFNCFKDHAKDFHFARARKNFVISLAMARKSGSLREVQEKLINDVYNEHELKDFYKQISTEEVDKIEKELSEADYLKI